MDKSELEKLIEKIDSKIEELDKQENPINLFKRALLKKEIISSVDDISDEKVEQLFKDIKENL